MSNPTNPKENEPVSFKTLVLGEPDEKKTYVGIRRYCAANRPEWIAVVEVEDEQTTWELQKSSSLGQLMAYYADASMEVDAVELFRPAYPWISHV